MNRFLALLFAVAVCTAPASAQRSNDITIDVHDADITDVIALLAAQADRNIVTDASVKPERVTMHLEHVGYDDALRAIVAAHGLQVRRAGNVMIVGAADSMNRRYDGANAPLAGTTAVLPVSHGIPQEIAKELQDALPAGSVIVPDGRTSSIVLSADADTIARARRLLAALDAPSDGLRAGQPTRTYHLQFVRADDAVKEVKALVTDGVVLADPDHNAVVVGADERIQAQARALFDALDRPSPQVSFEVKVADVTPVDDDSNFGIEVGGADLHGTPTNGSTAYAFTGGSIPVTVRLNALVTQGRAQVLATPKIVTLNNKEADLLIGETYPIVYNTSVLGGQNVQFVDIGVKLRLTPTIGPDGIVTAELHPEYSELLGVTGTGYPIIANRKIDSTLRVANDQTIVLGGLMRDVTDQTISRVPGLADVPVLGAFFKNKEMHHEHDEIVFMITPHVIYPAKEPASAR